MRFEPLQFDNWGDALGTMIGAAFLGAGIGGGFGLIGAVLLVSIFTDPPSARKRAAHTPTDREKP